MKTLRLLAVAISVCICAACTSKESAQTTSPTSPEDQVVSADSSDAAMDTTLMEGDTATLRKQ